jgi:hypothetical protein
MVLPDSLAYRRETLTTDASAACTVVPVGQTPIVADVRALTEGAVASFQDDPRDAAVARLLLTVGLTTTNLLETFAVRLSYEVAAFVPHP